MEATVTLSIAGADAHLASPREAAAGIKAAAAVFERNAADPLACAEAARKRDEGHPLSRDEALACVIWDEADDAAWRAVTLGWLSREVDIGLGVS